MSVCRVQQQHVRNDLKQITLASSVWSVVVNNDDDCLVGDNSGGGGSPCLVSDHLQQQRPHPHFSWSRTVVMWKTATLLVVCTQNQTYSLLCCVLWQICYEQGLPLFWRQIYESKLINHVLLLAWLAAIVRIGGSGIHVCGNCQSVFYVLMCLWCIYRKKPGI